MSQADFGKRPYSKACISCKRLIPPEGKIQFSRCPMQSFDDLVTLDWINCAPGSYGCDMHEEET